MDGLFFFCGDLLSRLCLVGLVWLPPCVSLSVSCQWFYPMVGYVMLFYHRVEPRTGYRGTLCIEGLLVCSATNKQPETGLLGGPPASLAQVQTLDSSLKLAPSIQIDAMAWVLVQMNTWKRGLG